MHSLDLQHLRAAAYSILCEANHPLPPHRIARHLFGPHRHEYPEAQVVVRTLLSDDPRFLETHDRCWCARDAAHVSVSFDRARYVVVDLETTGSVIGVDEIIEIGAVAIQRGKVIEHFSSLAKVKRSIPAWIERLTGIGSHDLQQAPSFPDLAPVLEKMLADSVFVAHDIRFDLPFLRWEFARHDLTMPPVTGLCTLCLSRHLWPDLPSRSLVDLARHFQVAHSRPHRADADAIATAGILTRELAVAREIGLRTLSDLFQLTERQASWRDVHFPLTAEAAE